MCSVAVTKPTLWPSHAMIRFAGRCAASLLRNTDDVWLASLPQQASGHAWAGPGHVGASITFGLHRPLEIDPSQAAPKAADADVRPETGMHKGTDRPIMARSQWLASTGRAARNRRLCRCLVSAAEARWNRAAGRTIAGRATAGHLTAVISGSYACRGSQHTCLSPSYPGPALAVAVEDKSGAALVWVLSSPS